MSSLRQYFWLWVALGIACCSLLFGLLLGLICWCIFKRGNNPYETTDDHTHHFYIQSSQYHPKKLEDELPPLPPRDPSLPKVKKSETDGAHPYSIEPKAETRPECDTSTLIDKLRQIPKPKSKEDKLKMDSKNNNTDSEDYDDVAVPGWVSEDYDDVEELQHP